MYHYNKNKEMLDDKRVIIIASKLWADNFGLKTMNFCFSLCFEYIYKIKIKLILYRIKDYKNSFRKMQLLRLRHYYYPKYEKRI